MKRIPAVPQDSTAPAEPPDPLKTLAESSVRVSYMVGQQIQRQSEQSGAIQDAIRQSNERMAEVIKQTLTTALESKGTPAKELDFRVIRESGQFVGMKVKIIR